MCVDLRVKCPLFLSDVNETRIFSKDFQIYIYILKYQISRKSALWKQSCSMRTDEQTDMTKVIVAFRDFANAFKNVAKLSPLYTFSKSVLLISFTIVNLT
jgi:hypothetical protein